IPIIRLQYSLPHPFWFTHPSHSPLFAIPMPSSSMLHFGSNILQLKLLANLRPILLPPSTTLTIVQFVMSSRKLARTANFPIRSWLLSLCSTLYVGLLPENATSAPKPSLLQTRLSHSSRL